MNEELMAVLDDEEFVDKLAFIQTPDELVALLATKNIVLEDSLSPEDAFEAFKKAESGEISEADLDAVSGGSLTVLGAIALGAAIVVGVNAVAFVGGYVYQKVQNAKNNKKKK